MHKLRENSRLFKQEKPDLQVYLETGINDRKEAVLHDDSLRIATENKTSSHVRNPQYQHNGKGTIVLRKNSILTQQTRRVFNNDKIIATQVVLDRHSSSKVIVGAIHAKSANTSIKWEQLKEQLVLAKKVYKDPQIWYVDLNADVVYTKTQKFLRQLRLEGWHTCIHTSWTHNSRSEGRNSNIDVVLHRNFRDSPPVVQFLDYNGRLSDHVPIKVTMAIREPSRTPPQNHLYLSKKHLYEHNVELLQQILDSSSPQTLIEVFEQFSLKEIKKTKYRTYTVQKRIKDLD